MLHTAKKTPLVLWAVWLLSAGFFVFLLIKGGYLSVYAHSALLFCAEKLIPSLFPFAVLSGIISAFSCGNGKPLPILGIPTGSLFAILLGIFSGYPMGAIAAKGLYDRGTLSEKEAAYLSACFNNASLAFLLFTVSPLFEGKGLLIFLSETLASLVAALLFKPRQTGTHTLALTENEMPTLATVTSAVTNAAHAMLTLTAFVTLFSILSGVLSIIKPLAALYPYLILLLEPTAAIRMLASSSSAASLPMAAFALGFSGISVLMQTVSVWEGKLPFVKTAVIRLVIGTLSAVFTLFFSKIL